MKQMWQQPQQIFGKLWGSGSSSEMSWMEAKGLGLALPTFGVWVVPREGGMTLDKAYTFSQDEYPWWTQALGFSQQPREAALLLKKRPGPGTTASNTQLLPYRPSRSPPHNSWSLPGQEALNSWPSSSPGLPSQQSSVYPFGALVFFNYLNPSLSLPGPTVSISKISSNLKCALNIPSSSWA